MYFLLKILISPFLLFFCRTPSSQTKTPVQKSPKKAASSERRGSICGQTDSKSEWLIQDFQSMNEDLIQD